MTAGTESIPNVCATCHATSDRVPIVNTGRYRPYWLCTDRVACTDRATAQQHEAAEAVRRAIEAEKAALQAEVTGVKAAVQANGTGPLQAVTDAVVAGIQDQAAAASTQPDGPDEAEGTK